MENSALAIFDEIWPKTMYYSTLSAAAPNFLAIRQTDFLYMYDHFLLSFQLILMIMKLLRVRNWKR